MKRLRTLFASTAFATSLAITGPVSALRCSRMVRALVASIARADAEFGWDHPKVNFPDPDFWTARR